MKVADVQARLEEIAALARIGSDGADETATIKELQLYADVIEAVSKGATNAKKLALCAISSQTIVFNRGTHV